MHNRRKRDDGSWCITGEPLEEDHMEDIVDLCARWELQPISHIADAFKHQVGPVVSRGQLAGGPVSDAGAERC